MSGTWFNTAFGRRASIVVPNSTNGSVRDAVLTIPVEWDDFWANVQDTTTWTDVVVVNPATNAVVPFQRSPGASAVTRALVLQLDDVTVANGVRHLWLYWGAAAQSDRATSFSYSAGATCTLELGLPGSADLVVRTSLHAVRTPPRPTLVKASTETREVWLDLKDALMVRGRPHSGQTGFEAVHLVDYDILRNGTSQTAMIEKDAVRIVDGTLIRVPVTGGTTGQDYVLTLLVTLKRGTDTRVLEERVWVRVYNALEV